MNHKQDKLQWLFLKKSWYFEFFKNSKNINNVLQKSPTFLFHNNNKKKYKLYIYYYICKLK